MSSQTFDDNSDLTTTITSSPPLPPTGSPSKKRKVSSRTREIEKSLPIGILKLISTYEPELFWHVSKTYRKHLELNAPRVYNYGKFLRFRFQQTDSHRFRVKNDEFSYKQDGIPIDNDMDAEWNDISHNDEMISTFDTRTAYPCTCEMCGDEIGDDEKPAYEIIVALYPRRGHRIAYTMRSITSDSPDIKPPLVDDLYRKVIMDRVTCLECRVLAGWWSCILD